MRRFTKPESDFRFVQYFLYTLYYSRDLGVDFDNKLKWNNHIDTVAKKVSSGIGAMRRIRDFVDRDTLIPVYKALIRPYFDYCSEVWNTLGNGLSNRLQKLQNRAARVMIPLDLKLALGMLGWESLETRRAKAKAVYMYKVLNGLAPKSLNDLFVSKSDITEYDPRGSYTSLQLPHPKTEKLKKSFSFCGAKLWNSLPTDLRNARMRFRNLKKEYALSNSDLVSFTRIYLYICICFIIVVIYCRIVCVFL